MNIFLPSTFYALPYANYFAEINAEFGAAVNKAITNRRRQRPRPIGGSDSTGAGLSLAVIRFYRRHLAMVALLLLRHERHYSRTIFAFTVTMVPINVYLLAYLYYARIPLLPLNDTMAFLLGLTFNQSVSVALFIWAPLRMTARVHGAARHLVAAQGALCGTEHAQAKLKLNQLVELLLWNNATARGARVYTATCGPFGQITKMSVFTVSRVIITGNAGIN